MSRLTHLQGERVHLFPYGDELWIVVIETFPYPNISIITAGYKEPAKILNILKFLSAITSYVLAFKKTTKKQQKNHQM